jgi:hypothetical protein
MQVVFMYASEGGVSVVVLCAADLGLLMSGYAVCTVTEPKRPGQWPPGGGRKGNRPDADHLLLFVSFQRCCRPWGGSCSSRRRCVSSRRCCGL